MNQDFTGLIKIVHPLQNSIPTFATQALVENTHT